MKCYSALVLAASRDTPDDPLAAYAQGRNKCVIDIAGRPMLAWVLEALLRSPQISRILVSTNDSRLFDQVPGFDTELACGRIRVVPSGPNLFASVESALRVDGISQCPALVTTADNPLLTTDMIAHFCRETEALAADASISMTRAEVMRAQHPDGQRRFYRFSDGEFSNCNLFAVVNDAAIAAAGMFRGGGQFGKKAWRILRAFGVTSFVLYRLRRLSLAGVGQRLSRSFGVRVCMVTMPFAEACIDVDNERTLLLARKVLSSRGPSLEARHSPCGDPAVGAHAVT